MIGGLDPGDLLGIESGPGSPAADDVDLVTVLDHELGHVLGLSGNAEASDLIDMTIGRACVGRPAPPIWRRLCRRQGPRAWSTSALPW